MPGGMAGTSPETKPQMGVPGGHSVGIFGSATCNQPVKIPKDPFFICAKKGTSPTVRIIRYPPCIGRLFGSFEMGTTEKILQVQSYCWWKKSCTTWDVQNLVNNGINYLSTGAGFLPSTVWPGDVIFRPSILLWMGLDSLGILTWPKHAQSTSLPKGTTNDQFVDIWCYLMPNISLYLSIYIYIYT